MIVIDIPMPQQCMTCPCTCRVRTENTSIRTMCRAKEARGDRYVLIDEYASTRPADCPIRMEVLRREFK